MDVLQQYILSLGYIDKLGRRGFINYNCIAVKMDSSKESISFIDMFGNSKNIPIPDDLYDAIFWFHIR